MEYHLQIREPGKTWLDRNLTHSQVCEYLSNLSRAQFREFLRGKIVTNANGDAVYLVDHD